MEIDAQKATFLPFLAGAAGSIVALKFAPGTTWVERITNVMSGTAFTWAIAPAAGEYFHLATPQMLSCLSFVLGLFGMSIAAAIMAAIKNLDLAKMISDKFGK